MISGEAISFLVGFFGTFIVVGFVCLLVAPSVIVLGRLLERQTQYLTGEMVRRD